MNGGINGVPPADPPRAPPAVSLLKAAPPGSFLVRRSSSFPGAFGLALRVGVPPPRATPKTGMDPPDPPEPCRPPRSTDIPQNAPNSPPPMEYLGSRASPQGPTP